MSHGFRLSRLPWHRSPKPDTRDGLVAIGLAAVLFALTQHAATVPDSDVDPVAAPALEKHQAKLPVEPAIGSRDPKHRALAAHLSRRYRINPEAAEEMVSTAYLAGEQVGLDPVLVLAVIAIESSFDPNAVSVAGAKGLMQIIPRYHEDKLEEHGGSGAVRDPLINVLVGTRILEQYIRGTGSLEAGLQRYNGALSDQSSRYASKVLRERERLRLIVDESERTRVTL
jgi:soluble lytic murein transglycosylase-like protein